MNDAAINETKCEGCGTALEYQIVSSGGKFGGMTGFTCPNPKCPATVKTGSQALRYRVKGEEKWIENNP